MQTDRGDRWPLYASECDFEEGDSISSDKREEIIVRLTKRARERCLHLLERQDYTRQKLAMKLREGHYPDDIIEVVLDFLEGIGCIDDIRYTLAYIDQHHDDKSRRNIEQVLMQRGISRDVIAQGFARFMDAGGVQDEAAQIAEILEKKHYDSNTADRKERSRLYNMLIRKGYSYEEVTKALNSEVE